MVWNVRFFQTARGDYPVKKFIEELDKPSYAKAIRTISLLEEYGPYLRFPYVKKIQDKLYELRIIGKESIRIFYTQHLNSYYLLSFPHFQLQN